jgi:hypothetical protein
VKFSNFSSFALLTMLSIAAGCGGSQPSAEAPPPAAPPEAAPPTAPASTAPEAATPPATPPAAETPAPAAEAAAPEAPAIDWDAMSHEQKMDRMKKVVLPKMKEVFMGFDAKDFADMKCVTCHGDGAKNQTFKMPNPKLPKLSYTDDFKKHREKKPEITKFMMEKVLPEMAALIGEPVMDPKTHKGLGCNACHVVGP